MKEGLRDRNAGVTVSLQELLYYAFFGCLLFAKGIGLYEGMAAFNICIVLALAFIGIKFLLTDYTVREWAGIILIMLCSLAAYLKTGEKAVIITCLTVLAIKNVPLKRIITIAFTVWTVTFYSMLIIHLLGWKEEIVLAHNKFGLGFILRHSLGFPHPNVLHISFVIWMALFLYLTPMTRRQLIKASVFLFLENLFIFAYSVSITGFLLAILYLGMNFYFAVRKEFRAVEKLLIQSILPLCILVSVIPPLFFKGRLYEIVDKLLNTRLKIWKYYLTTFMPGLFGTKVWSPSYEELSMDCSYLYLLYYYGIILFVLIMGLFGYVIWKYTKENNRKELAIILGMLIAGITEPYLFNFSFKNIILLFAGEVLFELLKKREGKKITVLPAADREIVIRKPQKLCCRLKKVKHVICHRNGKSKMLTVVCAIAAGVFAAVLAGTMYREPERIYVRSERCDYVKGDGITLDEIPEENCLVYGYTDSDTRFYGFDGNMIRLERIRVCMTGAAAGLLAGAVLFLLAICYNQLVLNRKREVL